MNHYELLYIIGGRFADNEIQPIIDDVTNFIKKYEGKINFTQNLGRKKLAYPINHNHQGYYILVEFDLAGKQLAQVNKELRLSPEILRHVIIRKKSVGQPIEIEIMKKSPEQEALDKEVENLINTSQTEEKDQNVANNATAEIGAESEAIPQKETVNKEIEAKEEVKKAEKETVKTSKKDKEEKVTSKKDEENEETLKSTSEDDANEKKEEKTKKDKKEKKVSLEDLDKKLEEILNNDII